MQGLAWLVAGAGLSPIVDRADRRRLMVAVDITRAMIIAALAAAVLAHAAGLRGTTPLDLETAAWTGTRPTSLPLIFPASRGRARLN